MPPLNISPLLLLLPLVTALTYKTYYIRILWPLKHLPFRSLKVDLVSIIEKGYKYLRQPLTQPAFSSLPPFVTYLSPFQRRNSFNLNYKPFSLFYSFSIYLYSSTLYALVTLRCALAALLLLHYHSTCYRHIPPTYSPISLYCPSLLPFYLLSLYLSSSI